MLSSAEEDLLAGKIPAPQKELATIAPIQELPLPVVQQQQANPSAGFWRIEYWQHYFNVDTKDVTRK
jgi:hypothetical protein